MPSVVIKTGTYSGYNVLVINERFVQSFNLLNLVVLLTFWSPSQVSTSGIPLTVVVSSTDRSIPISSKIVKLTIDNYTTILIRSWLKECLYCSM